MALPRLDTPQYELTLYNGDNIKFRPFLVKEQKILFMAMEEKNTKHTLNALKQVINNCTFDQIDIDKLPIFEVENIFIRLREKSVGEQIEFKIKCVDTECDGLTPMSLDLGEVSYDRENIPNTSLQISESVTLNMKFPTLKNIESLTSLEKVEDNFTFIASCIDSIEADGNVYTMDTTSKEELQAFLESMTTSQFETLKNFFINLPKVSKEVSYTCSACSKEQSRVIEGLQSFLV